MKILGGGGDQDYSRLSTTHGHITDCKLNSVVYAGVCEVILEILGFYMWNDTIHTIPDINNNASS